MPLATLLKKNASTQIKKLAHREKYLLVERSTQYTVADDHKANYISFQDITICKKLFNFNNTCSFNLINFSI